MIRPMDPVQTARRRRTWWELFACTFVVVLIVASLVAVALFVLFVVSVNSWGNNK